MQEQIRVGIVGANAKKSWASVSHVPAIKGRTSGLFIIVAVRNSSVRGRSAMVVRTATLGGNEFVGDLEAAQDLKVFAILAHNHLF